MRMEAKSRVAEAVASRASTPNNFSPGQWVYVWRKVKGRAKTHALQRDRWVGPGAVVWQNGQTVLVAMRSRLWKCSSLQVRYATRAESLGAELLDEVTFKELQQDLKDPGKRVGATDVESEGEPPPEAWDSPQSAEGQAAPEPRVLTRRGIPAPPRSAPDSILEQASSGDPATGASSPSRPYTESEMDLEVSRSKGSQDPAPGRRTYLHQAKPRGGSANSPSSSGLFRSEHGRRPLDPSVSTRRGGARQRAG